MALTYTELEAVTDAYFMADGRRAVDIYFDDCFLMDRFLKQKKGIWERPNGGERIKVPLMYDGQEAGFYTRGQALTSDDRENLQSAFFYWKHAWLN